MTDETSNIFNQNGEQVKEFVVKNKSREIAVSSANLEGTVPPLGKIVGDGLTQTAPTETVQTPTVTPTAPTQIETPVPETTPVPQESAPVQPTQTVASPAPETVTAPTVTPEVATPVTPVVPTPEVTMPATESVPTQSVETPVQAPEVAPTDPLPEALEDLSSREIKPAGYTDVIEEKPIETANIDSLNSPLVPQEEKVEETHVEEKPEEPVPMEMPKIDFSETVVNEPTQTDGLFDLNATVAETPAVPQETTVPPEMAQPTDSMIPTTEPTEVPTMETNEVVADTPFTEPVSNPAPEMNVPTQTAPELSVMDTPVETPMENPLEAPVETHVDALTQTAVEMPVDTLTETPVDTLPDTNNDLPTLDETLPKMEDTVEELNTDTVKSVNVDNDVLAKIEELQTEINILINRFKEDLEKNKETTAEVVENTIPETMENPMANEEANITLDNPLPTSDIPVDMTPETTVVDTKEPDDFGTTQETTKDDEFTVDDTQISGQKGYFI